MGSLAKKSIGGSIHRIREFELEKVNLADEFDILQIVGEGWFGKILLVEHKATDTEMVLKALPKPYTAIRDFYREFHYGLHLGAHKNIITTYDVVFETAGFYVFSQEYAPLGDLTSNVSETGIGELHTKRVAKQLSAALEHLHTRDLVHRDVKLDNILVFKSDFSRIKLCDFGETRRSGSVVPRRNEWLPYAPPEVLQIETDGNYMAATSHDVWQFAIVIFVCLTGCLPWQKAALDDPRYIRYYSWHTSTMPLKRQPKLFKLVTSKAQKLFRKYLEPRPEKRPAGLAEVHRFLEDRWMSKGMEKINETAAEDEGLCPSMYSFHSSPEEKNKLLFTLTQYGIETTVDRSAKKDRIRQWIQTSVIEEVDEEEEQTEEDLGIRDNQTGPIGERVVERGPITDERVVKNSHINLDMKNSKKERRHSTVSLRKYSDIYTPPIDPRIPLENQRYKMSKTAPQEMMASNGNSHYTSNENFNANNQISTTQRKLSLADEQQVINNIRDNNTGDNNTRDNNTRDNNTQQSTPYKLQNALPFQNMVVNGINDSEESVHSSDSSSTVRHKINVQIPQSEKFVNYPPQQNNSVPTRSRQKNAQNGKMNGTVAKNVPSTPPVNKRPMADEKIFRAYNKTNPKRSSSKHGK